MINEKGWFISNYKKALKEIPKIRKIKMKENYPSSTECYQYSCDEYIKFMEEGSKIIEDELSMLRYQYESERALDVNSTNRDIWK